MERLDEFRGIPVYGQDALFVHAAPRGAHGVRDGEELPHGVLALVPVAIGLLAGDRVFAGELGRLGGDFIEGRVLAQRLDAPILEQLGVPLDDALAGVVRDVEQALGVVRTPGLRRLELLAPDILEVLVGLDQVVEVHELALAAIGDGARHFVEARLVALDHCLGLGSVGGRALAPRDRDDLEVDIGIGGREGVVQVIDAGDGGAGGGVRRIVIGIADHQHFDDGLVLRDRRCGDRQGEERGSRKQ